MVAHSHRRRPKTSRAKPRKPTKAAPKAAKSTKRRKKRRVMIPANFTLRRRVPDAIGAVTV